jgi:hypothetical protein
MGKNVEKSEASGVETEITPEMIAAAGKVLEEEFYFTFPLTQGSAATLAEDVLRAAFRAKSDVERPR